MLAIVLESSTLGPPSLLVILPTFRRPAPLVWALTSVLLQQVDQLPVAGAKVVVVNNDGRREEVDRAVATALAEAGPTPWKVEVLHREPQLDPVLSWYGAIRQYAAEGDLAFLHGDDDLMLPGSVAARASALLGSPAVTLVSRARSGLLFDSGQPARAWMASGMTLGPVPASETREVRPGEVGRHECTFIGNHAYRAGEALWTAYRSALAKLERLPITGPNQRAMLPLLLALELAEAGALVATDQVGVVRGQSRDEVLGARWGLANWSVGVMVATVLITLDGAPWRGRSDLEALRQEYGSLLARWYLVGLLDARARTQLRALGLTATRAYSGAGLLQLPSAVSLVLRSLTGTRSLRTRLAAGFDPCTREAVLRRLRGAAP